MSWFRLPSELKLILCIILIAFLAGIAYSGYLLYATVREIVAHTQTPLLLLLSSPRLTEFKVREERESKEVPALLPNLDKKERVNILLRG